MKLSPLQKYILIQGIGAKDKTISKSVLEKFYSSKAVKPNAKDIISIITKSVERLIKKELIIGYGWKTPQKWYIRQGKLTPKGIKAAKDLLGIQQKLPLKNKSKK
ncbi:MAG: hypothetical protein PHW95_00295 [Patescibacteria group bacterium]|nr:hypothetical protein [Patescibacteria group bacterium]